MRSASKPAMLLTRTVRLVGDSIALRIHCAGGSAVTTGTVTVRTKTALHGARRTLGSASFNCPGTTVRTAHVVVRESLRALLRAHRHAVTATAFLALRDEGGALSVATPSLLVALGRR